MSKSKILLKVTGSIAAYKSAEVLSRLLKKGFEVRVVASASALKFVGAATFEGLTGERVYSDTFSSGEMMSHIHLMRWADLVITAPATANYINKCAAGLSDDLVSTLFLAHNFDKPYLMAPAMNSSMLMHPITQSSISRLTELGIQMLSTGLGGLACGEVGTGRLLEPEALVEIIEDRLKSSGPTKIISLIEDSNSNPVPAPSLPVSAKKILITSGGTKEPIDEVRHLGNKSTGRTGALLARSFTEAGHLVTYLHAEDAVRAPESFKQESFSSFKELDGQLRRLLRQESYDVVIHAAAVSDFSISHLETEAGERLSPEGKIDSRQNIKIVLCPNFKIIDRIRSYSSNPDLSLVGFKLTSGAAQTHITSAVSKVFEDSGARAVVHNDTSEITGKAHPFHIYDSKSKAPIVCEGAESLVVGLCQLMNWCNDTVAQGDSL